MDNSGWICIHRKMTDWEWYQDSNVKAVFLHCLLKANWEEKKWQGQIVKRGEFITSYDHLAQELGMNVSSVRRALEKLKQTGEISTKSTNKNTVVKCLKYCVYQDVDTSERQTNDKQTTTTNNNNNKNKYNNYNKYRGRKKLKSEPNFDINELYEKAIHNDNYDV